MRVRLRIVDQIEVPQLEPPYLELARHHNEDSACFGGSYPSSTAQGSKLMDWADGVFLEHGVRHVGRLVVVGNEKFRSAPAYCIKTGRIWVICSFFTI